MKYCTNCGAQIPDGSKFCTVCGTPAPAQDQAQRSAPQQDQTQQNPYYNQQNNAQYQQYQQQQQYQQPVYRPAPQYFDGKGLCIAGLVLGIISLVLSFFGLYGGVIGLVVGIIGVICAASGRKKALSQGVMSGIGTAGLVCSIIGLVFCAIIFIVGSVILSELDSIFD